MLVTVAGPFYASGTFWAAAAVFVALGVGIGAIWATLRANHPMRRLHYWMGDTRLLQPHESLNGSLEIRRNGTVLRDPRLVRVHLTNPSSRDIGSGAFDQSAPIRADIGVPILELLDVESQPTTSAAPEATVAGTELRVGPGRIGHGESVTYLLLADGEPTYSCQHSLIDVTVQNKPPLVAASPQAVMVVLVALALIAVLIAGGVVWGTVQWAA